MKHELTQREPVGLDVTQTLEQLDRCTSVTEAKGIRDKAEAIRKYLRGQKVGRAQQNKYAEVKLKAERRLGVLLAGTELNRGRPATKGGQRDRLSTLQQLLDAENPNQAQCWSKRWQAEASVPEEMFKAYVKETKEDDLGELTAAGLLNLVREMRQARERAREAKKAKEAPQRAVLCECDALTFLRGVAPQSVDLLLTDPPYSTDVEINPFSGWLLHALPKLKRASLVHITGLRIGRRSLRPRPARRSGSSHRRVIRP